MAKNKKTRKITFRCSEKIYDFIENGCEEAGCNRSQVITGIIIDYMRFLKKK